jgi:cytochrome c553
MALEHESRIAMKKFLLGFAALSLLTACGQQSGTTAPAEPPADPAAGQAIAEAECSGCHGADGHGEVPGIPHLAGQPLAYLEQALHDYQEGKRTHAALRDLTSHMSDADLRNVAAWYASLPPVTMPNAGHLQMTSYEQGEQLAQTCAECHGDKGNSTMAGVPSLAGQQPLYFIAATQAYLHGIREMSGMEETLRGLSKTDIEKLALYYASQTPAPREAPLYGDPQAGEPLSAACGGCHGAGGVSHDAATPSLASQDPDYLVKATKAYRGHVRLHDVMFGEKSDEDIQNIAAYYASQPSRAAEDEPMSAEKLTRSCDRCHGIGVQIPTMAVPRLNGQDRDYLIMSLRAYRDDKRESTMMHKMSLPYSDSMIEAVATIYANRPPK